MNYILKTEWSETTFESMREKSNTIDDYVVACLKNVNLQGISVCARGSYGRMELTRRSDLDIFVVVQSKSVCTSNIIRLLRDNSNAYFSVQVYPEGYDRRNLNYLPFLFTVTETRFITGDKDVFRRFIQSYRSHISMLTFSRLIKLYYNDPGRNPIPSNPDSPHYYNLKRGHAGIVDYEFILLLAARFNLTKEAKLKRLIAYGKYFVLLKSKLHDTHGSAMENSLDYEEGYSQLEEGMWFFHPFLINLVRKDFRAIQYRFLNRLLA